MSNILSKDDLVEDENTIPVLDEGYVRLVDRMGSDLSVANAARASYAKESKEMGPGDVKLINFLAREGHMSPFRHAMLTFEFKAPLMVARQHWKYVVGSDHTMDSWNESSRRYITSEAEFYIPNSIEWRTTPDSSKQGSGGPLGRFEGEMLTMSLQQYVEEGENLYTWAMNLGVAPEQARLFLPAYGMYLYYRWTCSLQSAAHFLRQRLEESAQKEITDFARATYQLTYQYFPASFGALIGEIRHD